MSITLQEGDTEAEIEIEEREGDEGCLDVYCNGQFIGHIAITHGLPHKLDVFMPKSRETSLIFDEIPGDQ